MLTVGAGCLGFRFDDSLCIYLFVMQTTEC